MKGEVIREKAHIWVQGNFPGLDDGTKAMMVIAYMSGYLEAMDEAIDNIKEVTYD